MGDGAVKTLIFRHSVNIIISLKQFGSQQLFIIYLWKVLHCNEFLAGNRQESGEI